jgi:L-lactate utilization protein LutB
MEKSLSAREEIMGKIRRALSDSPDTRGGETPALERAQPVRSADGSLVTQFRIEMEKLGGRVVDAGTEDEIKGYIGGLLTDCKSVAVSDEISARWPGICDGIRGRGIEIVPALREFAIGAGGVAKRVPGPVSGQESLFGEAAGEQAGGPPSNGSVADLMESYKLLLFDAGVGITTADYAIADTGTLVLLSKKSTNTARDSSIETREAGPSEPRADGEQHRLISLVPPVHVCLLERKRIVANLTELLTVVHKDFYSKGGPPLAMTFISGPSRTADIELTLTRGVHGPRQVHVLLQVES